MSWFIPLPIHIMRNKIKVTGLVDERIRIKVFMKMYVIDCKNDLFVINTMNFKCHRDL